VGLSRSADPFVIWTSGSESIVLLIKMQWMFS